MTHVGPTAPRTAQRTRQHTECPWTDECRKALSRKTMEDDSAMKKNERMPFTGTSLNPEIILLSGVSQNQKEHYHKQSHASKNAHR